MARGLNKVMIIGNLGKDPEMKYNPQGTPITTFSVAVSRTWKVARWAAIRGDRMVPRRGLGATC